eukprot:jgi/Hompol1/1126/HPOL_000046-RA
MARSTMYVAYKNDANATMLSIRSAPGYISPTIQANKTATLSPIDQYAAPGWAQISFTAIRPASINDGFDVTAASTYIYALSDTPPASPNDVASPLTYHRARGIIMGFNLMTDALSVAAVQGSELSHPLDQNITTGDDKPSVVLGQTFGANSLPLLTLPNNIGYDEILRIHGFLMFIAWTLSPAIGIFIARYLKDYLGLWWLRLHMLFMCVFTMLFTIAGITLVYLYKMPPHFQGDSHRSLGAAIGIGMFAQIFLGAAADAMFSPKRRAVPWWDIAHWWFGRILVLAAVVNTFNGLSLYQDLGYEMHFGIKIAYGVSIGLVAGIFVFAEVAIGRTPSFADSELSMPGMCSCTTLLHATNTEHGKLNTPASGPLSSKVAEL